MVTFHGYVSLPQDIMGLSWTKISLTNLKFGGILGKSPREKNTIPVT